MHRLTEVFISLHQEAGFCEWYNPFLRGYVEEGNFNSDRQELRNKFQRVFAWDKFGPGRRTQNNFVLIAGDGENGSMLWLARVLLLCRLISRTDSDGTEYIFS